MKRKAESLSKESFFELEEHSQPKRVRQQTLILYKKCTRIRNKNRKTDQRNQNAQKEADSFIDSILMPFSSQQDETFDPPIEESIEETRKLLTHFPAMPDLFQIEPENQFIFDDYIDLFPAKDELWQQFNYEEETYPKYEETQKEQEKKEKKEEQDERQKDGNENEKQKEEDEEEEEEEEEEDEKEEGESEDEDDINELEEQDQRENEKQSGHLDKELEEEEQRINMLLWQTDMREMADDEKEERQGENENENESENENENQQEGNEEEEEEEEQEETENGTQIIPVARLPVRKILDSEDPLMLRCEACTICQSLFQKGDMVKTLPCFHLFHAFEIDQWLEEQTNCPLCKIDISQ